MADQIQPTPFVNTALLSQFTNRTVRIVGRLIEANPTNAKFESSDQGQFTVDLQPGSQFEDGFYEFVGQVKPDMSIQELSHTPFGHNFDMENHNALVKFTHRLSELYYDV
ncbi:replication factor A protein 3 [Paraphysoderma sedebokerense]|nr:replication factor A protein 3 [Paraphysoderma sedebokerense]KAI9139965.1 replication factor A protein 3 [Paraphysoderma sedebokerense]